MHGWDGGIQDMRAEGKMNENGWMDGWMDRRVVVSVWN
jgi:hypothetical protein